MVPRIHRSCAAAQIPPRIRRKEKPGLEPPLGSLCRRRRSEEGSENSERWRRHYPTRSPADSEEDGYAGGDVQSRSASRRSVISGSTGGATLRQHSEAGPWICCAATGTRSKRCGCTAVRTAVRRRVWRGDGFVFRLMRWTGLRAGFSDWRLITWTLGRGGLSRRVSLLGPRSRTVRSGLSGYRAWNATLVLGILASAVLKTEASLEDIVYNWDKKRMALCFRVLSSTHQR